MDIINDNSLIPKLCGISILSLVSMVIGFLPILIHSYFKVKPNYDQNSGRKDRYKRLLAHMSAFGGGVLLSTTFLHLLPEIRNTIEEMRQRKVLSYEGSVQLPEMLMCLGFLCLYLIEEVGHIIISNNKSVEVEERNVEKVVSNMLDSNAGVDLQETNSNQPGISSGNVRESCDKQTTEFKRITVDDIIEAVHCHHGDGDRLPRQNDSMVFLTESSGRNFLLIFALSIHEGFEGLAIGLERQSDAAWYMILGVGSHKAVIAFCIGIQMISSKLNRKVMVIYVFLFSTATSIGVIFGMFLSMERGVFSVILQGLATGTLLHVVFFELLKPHSKHTPFMGVFLGFVSMAALKYFST